MMPGTKAFAGFVLVASAVALGTALSSQYWGGLLPCELCYLERWPWGIAITVSLVALLVGGRKALPGVAVATAIVFAASVAIAFYHVGVEQRWFAGPTACTAQDIGAMTLEEMKRQILATAPVQCDKVQWSLLGVSLAGWNCLASFVMASISVTVFMRARRPSAWRAAA